MSLAEEIQFDMCDNPERLAELRRRAEKMQLARLRRASSSYSQIRGNSPEHDNVPIVERIAAWDDAWLELCLDQWCCGQKQRQPPQAVFILSEHDSFAVPAVHSAIGWFDDRGGAAVADPEMIVALHPELISSQSDHGLSLNLFQGAFRIASCIVEIALEARMNLVVRISTAADPSLHQLCQRLSTLGYTIMCVTRSGPSPWQSELSSAAFAALWKSRGNQWCNLATRTQPQVRPNRQPPPQLQSKPTPTPTDPESSTYLRRLQQAIRLKADEE